MNNPLYPGFLPVTRREMDAMGIEQFDFVYVTGDSYVDHPSFGVAIIGRVIEKLGFTVGIISQPDWRSTKDFTVYGRPKYAFLVTGGCIDSMVNHYTAAKKRRSDDAYTAGGKRANAPTAPLSFIATVSERLTEMFLLLSAGLKRLCAALPITTIGATRSDVRYCLTAVRISAVSAWARLLPNR